MLLLSNMLMEGPLYTIENSLAPLFAYFPLNRSAFAKFLHKDYGLSGQAKNV